MRLSILLMSLGLFVWIGCSSDENEACSDVDPTCSRVAKASLESTSGGKEFTVNEMFELDASDSIYDKITWYVNGDKDDGCSGSEYCDLSFAVAGIYDVKVEVIVGATGEVFLGAAGSPEDTDDSSSMTITILPDTATANSGAGGAAAAAAKSCANAAGSNTLIGEAGGKCIVVSNTDDAACRGASQGGDEHSLCKSWATAAGVCASKGDGWTLPPKELLVQLYADKGSGTPVTSKGYCIANSGVCGVHTNTSQGQPYYYWTASGYNGAQATAVDFRSGSTGLFAISAEYSVRCVGYLDPS